MPTRGRRLPTLGRNWRMAARDGRHGVNPQNFAESRAIPDRFLRCLQKPDKTRSISPLFLLVAVVEKRLRAGKSCLQIVHARSFWDQKMIFRIRGNVVSVGQIGDRRLRKPRHFRIFSPLRRTVNGFEWNSTVWDIYYYRAEPCPARAVFAAPGT